jgi:ATP-dependent DNA helicase RecQ
MPVNVSNSSSKDIAVNVSSGGVPFPELEAALKRYFGYDGFRPGQRQVMVNALENQDQLIVMPTGAGKSLCFQLPALLKPGMMVVVSPLIALMQDQVQALQANGIAATFLNSSLAAAETYARLQQIRQKTIKLLYVAPERLLMPEFLELLNTHGQISAFAIDEAHCVSEWGHDFRQEYRQLSQIRQQFPQVPVLALTATATERVRQDIIEQLQLRQPQLYLGSFNRPNLHYEVRPKHKHTYSDLVGFIRQQAGAGIIYCLSRRRVDELVVKLQRDGVAALPYHAGLDNTTRERNQTQFIRDDVAVMVATIAFGMGINKPDVRYVVHYDLPRTLEGYYQEAGRAGRDNESAHCLLLYGREDIRTIEFLINQKVDPTTGAPLENEQRLAQQQLRRVIDYAEATECRRTVQLSYFGEDFAGGCQQCDNCCSPKPLEDWTIPAQKFLSCVARCQERFGMNYIIDVLRGSKSERILKNRHDQLSTYGIGQDWSVENWRLLGRSLIHQRLLGETSNGYAVLQLNPQSWQVLRNQHPVMVAVTATLTTSVPAAVPIEGANELLQRLQGLRKRLADQQEVPPYVVFSNLSLQMMARQQPQNRAQFAQISGVGSRKLEQYGDIFLTEIRAFRQEKGLSVLPDGDNTAAPAPTSPRRRLAVVGTTQLQTLALYQRGLSVATIAAQRQLKQSTVINHLAELLRLNYPIDLDQLVPTARQTQIQQAIAVVGAASRRALRDHLGESFSYDEIHLVQAAWLRQATAQIDESSDG